MNDKKDILDKATEAINAENIEAKVPDEVLKATLLKLAQATAGEVRTNSTKSVIERIILMKSYKKIAVAAILIIGILYGVSYFGGSIDGSSLVWADVLQQVKQVQTVIYKISTTMDGEFFAEMPEEDRMTEMEMSIVMSDEYGMKMETFVDGKISHLMYMLHGEKVMLSIMHEQKKYIRMELDDETITKAQQQSNDPRYMASQMMGSEYVELGRSVIDGVDVEGFEVDDPETMGGMFEENNTILWIDVDTGWPVQIEMEVTMEMAGKSMHMVMVMHDFQWGVEIDPAEFIPDIGDYTELANIQIPKMDENSAIEGLRMFADMADRYPSKLNIMTIMNEMTEIKTTQLKQESQARDAARENMAEEELAQDPKMAAEELTKARQERAKVREEIMKTIKDPTITAEERRKAFGELTKAAKEWKEDIEERNKAFEEENKAFEEEIKATEERIKAIKENTAALEEQLAQGMGEGIEEKMSIMLVGTFYMELVTEKRDPVYYGENVTPEDTDLILLRWRLDSGDYSVIYGDLQTETVSAERLAELESMITN